MFLARDMKRDAVVLDYRFVDGREGIEVDHLDADQLAKRYPDPLFPATHVLKVWNSNSYWVQLCQGPHASQGLLHQGTNATGPHGPNQKEQPTNHSPCTSAQPTGCAPPKVVVDSAPRNSSMV